MKSRLARFLFAYRLTPQTTTGVAPAEMLLGRRPRSRLDILRPLTSETVETQQMKQRQKHDVHAHERLLQEGDPVLVRNYPKRNKWLPGMIAKKTGLVSYAVTLTNDNNCRCHQDQLRKHFVGVDVADIPDVEVEEFATPPQDPKLPTPPQDPKLPTPPQDPTLPEPAETDLEVTPKVYPSLVGNRSRLDGSNQRGTKRTDNWYTYTLS